MTPGRRFKKRYTNRRIGKTNRWNDLLIGTGFMPQETKHCQSGLDLLDPNIERISVFWGRDRTLFAVFDVHC